ncbi:hypothetical protein RND81_14G141500 [Saponaria officinalis]|uniref:F-box/LRR-repeat protein 15/At3g58940/PEG3-like LRR domain-containing protein n=1 Tax=Saponaria officinalis TaxID=3572 RepID=A0AAW1GPM6_SAPOF
MDSEVVVLDRLAELSDQTLIHILSFLPTVDAVRTMLVKRFGTLWTFLPNLDLDDSNFDLYSKITRFRIHIGDCYYSDIEERNLSHELDSWIEFALRKNVEILEFNVGMVEPCELLYKLPFSEFVSDSLTELKLEFLEMKLQTRIQMGVLRVLRLIRVEISDAVFQEIVRGCPLLQELEIYNCTLNNLKIDASNVEKLILDTSEHYDSGPVINCPHLRSFRFTGFVNRIEVQDLSSLDVTFNLRSQYSEFKEFDQFLAALKPVLSAKVVSFSSEFVTVLFHCMLKHLPRLSINWKQVELSMWLTEKHIPGLSRLLPITSWHDTHFYTIRHSTLHLKPNTLNDSQRATSDIYNLVCVTAPLEAELDNYSVDEEEYFSSSLKRVVISNISMCSYPTLVRLMNSLLKNASVLSELVICYKTDHKSLYHSVLSSEEWAEFCNKLPTFPKASPHVRVSLF